MVRANEPTDKRVAQCFSLYFWLFWPTVEEVGNDDDDDEEEDDDDDSDDDEEDP